MKTLFVVVTAGLTFSGLVWGQAWNHNPAAHRSLALGYCDTAVCHVRRQCHG